MTVAQTRKCPFRASRVVAILLYESFSHRDMVVGCSSELETDYGSETRATLCPLPLPSFGGEHAQPESELREDSSFLRQMPDFHAI